MFVHFVKTLSALFPRLVTLIRLPFTSSAVINLLRDLHPQGGPMQPEIRIVVQSHKSSLVTIDKNKIMIKIII